MFLKELRGARYTYEIALGISELPHHEFPARISCWSENALSTEALCRLERIFYNVNSDIEENVRFEVWALTDPASNRVSVSRAR